MTIHKTKIVGTCGLIELSRTEKWSAVDYLKDTIARRHPRIDNYVCDEVLKDLLIGAKEVCNSKWMVGLVDYGIRHGSGEFQYRLELVYNKSTLANAKGLFKELLLSPSALDGVRGRCVDRRNSEYSYELIADCNDAGNVSPGIHRLIRFIHILSVRKTYQTD